jgi:hypothetical protein
MKKAILLAATAMFAVLMMAPAAFADEMDDSTMMEDSMMMEDTSMGMEDDTMMMEDTSMGMEDDMDEEGTTSGMGTGDSDLPDSGGPAILLPAAALLLGSGILTFAVLRRR